MVPCALARALGRVLQRLDLHHICPGQVLQGRHGSIQRRQRFIQVALCTSVECVFVCVCVCV